MGSTIGDGASVGKGAYVAPGAVVEAGATVPAGQLVSGNPAAVVRALSEGEVLGLANTTEALVQLGEMHNKECMKGFIEIEQDKTDAKWVEERSIDYDSSLGLLERNPRAQVW